MTRHAVCLSGKTPSRLTPGERDLVLPKGFLKHFDVLL